MMKNLLRGTPNEVELHILGKARHKPSNKAWLERAHEKHFGRNVFFGWFKFKFKWLGRRPHDRH